MKNKPRNIYTRILSLVLCVVMFSLLVLNVFASEQTVENTASEVETSGQQVENTLVETKVKSSKKAFKFIEVSDNNVKTKKSIKPRAKKSEVTAANE